MRPSEVLRIAGAGNKFV
jgi:3'-phosphoadenosine 5'-phosphosulfate (PAPS) 3'-phosphatase